MYYTKLSRAIKIKSESLIPHFVQIESIRHRKLSKENFKVEYNKFS